MTLNKDQHILNLIATKESRESGYRLLLQTYQERLYWQIRKHVLTHDDADDVLQNVFIKVFKGIHNFRGDSKLSSWLYRIAYNESMTHLTKRSKELQISTNELKDYLVSQLEADVYFCGDEATLALQKALLQLPERQKEIFNYRYFDELKFKEIASILGLTEGAVKASYHIAAKKIKDYLIND
jgi:RNA polymerase sigma-70 factor (ECF subfamily)